MSTTIDHYAVIGHPVVHSLSPFVHQFFAKQTGQSIRYLTIEATATEFANQVRLFRKKKGKGFNVTVPCKQAAYRFADVVTQRAERAKAVNTISIKDDGTLKGDNTDGIGFIRDIMTNYNYVLTDKNVLLLGAGGAARGILGSILDQSPKKIHVANRTRQTAEALRSDFPDFGEIEITDFEGIRGQYDLVIHATSARVCPRNLGLDSAVLGKSCFCYDLMYRHDLTPFLKWAIEHRAERVADGTGMLVEQAAESFFIWRDLRPNTSNLIQTLLQKKETAAYKVLKEGLAYPPGAE